MPKKTDPLESPDGDSTKQDPDFQFVQVSRPQVGEYWDAVRKIGNSIIGGDFSGSARGQGSIDIQQARSNPADVASGEESIIFGSHARASGDRSLALGSYAATDLPDTCNLSGLILLKANYGNALTNLCEWGAAEIVLATPVVTFLQVSTTVITLPTNGTHKSVFFADECIVIATHMRGNTVIAPTVQFGNATDLDCLVPPTGCSHIWQQERYDRFAITWDNGQTTLSASVCIPGAMTIGGDLKGRFLFKGLLVEEEGDAE